MYIRGFTVLVAAATTGPAWADPPPSPEFLLAAFADNQQRLRSGVVRMDGTLLRRSTSLPTIDAPVKLFCAFDTDAKLFRFDRDELTRAKARYVDGKVIVSREPTPGGGKYARTPARLIAWERQRPEAVNLLPLALGADQAAFAVRSFDPRILGLANGTSVNVASVPDQQIDNFQRRLTAAGVGTSEVRPGIIRLRLPGKVYSQEIDFDRAVGYMPVRYADVPPAKDGQPAEPIISAATTWKARGGVYVPVTARFQETSDDSPFLTRYDLTLTWDVVNGPVDETLLTVHGLGLPPETIISDNTKGESGRPLGRVGDATPNPRLAVVEATPSPAPARDRRWAWVVGGVVLLVALVAVLRFRRR